MTTSAPGFTPPPDKLVKLLQAYRALVPAADDPDSDDVEVVLDAVIAPEMVVGYLLEPSESLGPRMSQLAVDFHGEFSSSLGLGMRPLRTVDPQELVELERQQRDLDDLRNVPLVTAEVLDRLRHRSRTETETDVSVLRRPSPNTGSTRP